MNRKGFTLVELLVATILLLIIMVGFLRGLLFYIQYSVREQTKDRAVEIMKEIASEVESLPYCVDNMPACANLSLQAHGGYAVNGWQAATCDTSGRCSFENVDLDGDNLADFRDPYNGTNDNFRNNPLNTAPWLNVRPGNATFCKGDPNRVCTSEAECPGVGPCVRGCVSRDNSPIRGRICGELFKGRWIYAGTTLARLVSANVEVGKSVGIVVWYFEPSTGEYRGYATTVMRDRR